MGKKLSGVDETSYVELYCWISLCVVHVFGSRAHYCSSVKIFLGGVLGSFMRITDFLTIFIKLV